MFEVLFLTLHLSVPCLRSVSFVFADYMLFIYRVMGGWGGEGKLSIVVLHRILVLHYGSVLMLEIRQQRSIIKYAGSMNEVFLT